MLKEALALVPLIMLTGAIGLKWHFGDSSPEGISWLFGLLIITTTVFYSIAFLGIRITGPGWAVDQIHKVKNDINKEKAEIKLLVQDLIRINSAILAAIAGLSIAVDRPQKEAVIKAIKLLEDLTGRVGIEKGEFYEEMTDTIGQILNEIKNGNTGPD